MASEKEIRNNTSVEIELTDKKPDNLPSLMSSRFLLFWIGGIACLFGLGYFFILINFDNPYTRAVSVIGFFVCGAIGYFRGRKIDRRENNG